MRILAALIAVACVAAAALVIVVMPHSEGDSRPELRYYCSTADPVGMTYTPSAYGAPKRLFVDIATDMVAGPDGLVAVLREDILDIYRYGEPLGSNRVKHRADLVGWIGDRLVFQDAGRFRWMQADRCVSDPFPARDVRHVYGLGSGFVTVEGRGRNSAVVLRSADGTPIRTTVVPGVVGYRWATWVGDFVVVETDRMIGNTVMTDRSELWAVSYATGEKTRLPLNSSIWDICRGRSTTEIIVARSETHKGRTVALHIDAVDLRDLSRRAIAVVRKGNPGLMMMVGLSPDKQWILLTEGYAEVGPGRLIAVRIGSSEVKVLQEEVYECAIVE